MTSIPMGDEPQTARRGGLVLVGNLDGVHRGHQAVLAEAARDAATRGLEAIVLTFDPHPARALGREPPPLLTRLARKVELVTRVDPRLRVSVERFDAAFAAQSPEEFAERVLVGRHRATDVVVGDNFRFGRARSGDMETLAEVGRALGFQARSVALVGDARGPYSSTRARAAIAAGDLAEVEAVLGRPHMVSGVVVEGDRRGRTIGFPTCNLAEVEEALPPFGVYAVLVDREGPSGATALARGVANLGVRPTVKHAGAAPTLEVHLFDLDEDLYGARLRVHLVQRLRPEQTFAGVAALKAAIGDDARRAREVLAGLVPDPDAAGAFR